MRLVITGASGLLGLNLALHAMESHHVIGVDRGRLSVPPFELVQADLLQEGVFERIIKESAAEAVIHCAAIADVDQCERDQETAWQVNTKLPGLVASACARAEVALIHISTDAVFDGMRSGAYAESDEPNPIGVYAKTKSAAEQVVLSANPRAVVARVNFYGWSVSGTRSLAEFFVGNLRAGRPVRGFSDVTFCPMFVQDLASLLISMLISGLSGLYHAVGPEPMTKYDFGIRIAREFDLDAHLISAASVKASGLSARRSHNLNLAVHKLSTALQTPLPDFSTGLASFRAQYEQGYPQQLMSYQQS